MVRVCARKVGASVACIRPLQCRNIILFILPAAFAAAASCSQVYAKHLKGRPLWSAGFGSYAYLPWVFIDHNLGMSLA